MVQKEETGECVETFNEREYECYMEAARKRARTRTIDPRDLVQAAWLRKLEEKEAKQEEPSVACADMSEEALGKRALNAVRTAFNKAYPYVKRHEQLSEIDESFLLADAVSLEMDIEAPKEVVAEVKRLAKVASEREAGAYIRTEVDGCGDAFEPYMPGITAEIDRQYEEVAENGGKETAGLRQAKARFLRKAKAKKGVKKAVAFAILFLAIGIGFGLGAKVRRDASEPRLDNSCHLIDDDGIKSQTCSRKPAGSEQWIASQTCDEMKIDIEYPATSQGIA